MALTFSSTDRDMPGMPPSPSMEQQLRLSFLPARPLNLRKEISLSQQENLLEHLQSAFPGPPLLSTQQPLPGNKAESGKSPITLQLSPRLSSSNGEGTSMTGGNSAFAAALERMRQKGAKLQQQQEEATGPSSHKQQAARTPQQKEALERLNAMAPTAEAALKRKQARRRRRTDDATNDSTPQLNATFRTNKGDTQTNLNADQPLLPLLLDKLRMGEDDEDHKNLAALMILSKSTTSFPNARKNYSSSHRLARMSQKSSHPKLNGSSGRLSLSHRSTGRLAMTRVRSSSRMLI